MYNTMWSILLPVYCCYYYLYYYCHCYNFFSRITQDYRN